MRIQKTGLVLVPSSLNSVHKLELYTQQTNSSLIIVCTLVFALLIFVRLFYFFACKYASVVLFNNIRLLNSAIVVVKTWESLTRYFWFLLDVSCTLR